MDPATQLMVATGVFGVIMALVAMVRAALDFWLNSMKERRLDERQRLADERADRRAMEQVEASRNVGTKVVEASAAAVAVASSAASHVEAVKVAAEATARAVEDVKVVAGETAEALKQAIKNGPQTAKVADCDARHEPLLQQVRTQGTQPPVVEAPVTVVAPKDRGG